MSDQGCVQMEFVVQTPGRDFADAIRIRLADVDKFEINKKKGIVWVETTLPWIVIQRRIESTGRRAVLTGFGGQSAVAVLEHDNEKFAVGEAWKVRGVVRFCSSSITGRGVVVDGFIKGLARNRKYLLNVHEYGDISEGCASVGDVYDSVEVSSDDGKAVFRFVNERLELADLIGRSVVLAESQNDQRRLSCGIIARSAAVFENSRKICSCDGATICGGWNRSDGSEEQQPETREDCIQVCMDCCWEMGDLIACFAMCFRQSLYQLGV